MANPNAVPYSSIPQEHLQYFENIIKQQQIPISVRLIDLVKGKGAFSEKPFQKGELLFREKPLCAMQHVDNRGTSWCCSNCFRFLGTNEDQFRRHQLILMQLNQSDIAPIGENIIFAGNVNKIGDSNAVGTVECSGGCGEMYCSENCRTESFVRHHRLLCVGPIDDPRHPLLQFKEHAVLNAEQFLLGAQAIATIISWWQSNGGDFQQAILPFAVFPRRFWWDVAAIESGRHPKELQYIANESWLSLREAMLPHVVQHPIYQQQVQQNPSVQPAIMQMFSLDFYGLLMGMFELNNNNIEIESPLQRFLKSLPDMPEPERTRIWTIMEPTVAQIIETIDHDDDDDDDHEHDDEEMATETGGKEEEELEDIDKANLSIWERAMSMPYVFPPFQGLGMFPLHGSMNHSCEPNTIVKFVDDYNSYLYAERDIPSVGIELTHSYTEDEAPLEDRQEDLKAYGFVCDCPKCVREMAEQNQSK